MLFNSYPFIFGFLPITLIVFFALTKFRLPELARVWLVIASLFFYSYWNVAYFPLLLVSLGVNYLIGQQFGRTQPGSPKAKLILWLGLSLNLGLLAYYKYANFLISSLPIPPLAAFLDRHLHPDEIILPLAISFYTFQQIAYLVDAYRGQTKEYSFLNYCLFVTFFPQLIAGPIVHHADIIPQFHKLRNFLLSHKNIALGVCLFIFGLSKKTLIADSLSPWVAGVFNNASEVNFFEAWVGALSYTFQLYFDFSGYSDMAIGLGLLFNIHLPFNFNSPYKSTSIIEFWRRWHITLSNFLRDYLYIPLGGNRYGEVRRSTNLFITMLLGGLWHGAGWTYVVWGGFHGGLLIINHGWRKLKISLPSVLAWALTLFAVLVGWVVFRSHNLSDARNLLLALLGLKGIVLPSDLQMVLPWVTQSSVQFMGWSDLLPHVPSFNGSESLLLLLGLLLTVALLPNTQQLLQRFKPTWWWAVMIGGLATVSLLALNRVSEFLYFAF